MLDRKELKRAAKEQISGNIGTFFLCFLVYMLLALISAFTLVGPLLVYPPLYLGITMLFLELTRGKKPRLEGMFKGFQQFWKSILLYLAIQLFSSLWAMLLFVPGIIKLLSYMFAPCILIENPDMPVMEAIDKSKKMTGGHKMELFVLGLSFFPWMLLTAATFGLAAIYLAPYMIAAYTNAYLKLKKTSAVENRVQ